MPDVHSSHEPNAATGADSLNTLGRVGFVGAGAAGSALAQAFASCGGHIVAVTGRSAAHAEALARRIPDCQPLPTPTAVAAACDTVFLAVPDDAIAPVAASIAWQPGQAAIHFAGAKGADVLDAAAERRARAAALHPLMTFPPAADQPADHLLARLAGCVWALETADAALATVLTSLVRRLHGRVIRLGAADRVPYHLAAVLASNYVVALLGAAVRLWEGFGVAPDEALPALLPLLRAAVDNLERVGLPAALTGPVARGDTGTIAAHLAWLEIQGTLNDGDRAGNVAALRDAYTALARLALPIARAKGTLSPQDAAALRALLDEPSQDAQPALPESDASAEQE
jgi:predicted short-subunit dehydrogenase-like oxidoreductase (DUF2520 family)